MAFKPLKILPVLIAEDEAIGRIEFETFDELLRYLTTNLHAWNVYNAGHSKPGFDLNKALLDVKREIAQANRARSVEASKRASKPRKKKSVTPAKILRFKTTYEAKWRGRKNPSRGWLTAAEKEFGLSAEQLQRRILKKTSA